MKCTHDNKKPYFYGYMTNDFIKNKWDQSQPYGGTNRSVGMPEYFCPDCLEDLHE
jgi:hypothetical protein